MYYAVMYGGKCVAKIVWDGVEPYQYPGQHDELLPDELNEIAVYQDNTVQPEEV